ncbi:MAG: tRNA glutamyl-Q(34) synthetase GluQRS [Gammaproteobacteria bacterium]|nr:tRNA glutamyl-Q(34) synthetase GluQRS [Gammaproteobacteria bacterium]
MPYTGRFAPSPTGPLHFGSLLAAVASWMEARSAGGHWLLRIEDVDRLREQPGAADAILRCLESFGLHWDGEVRRQSMRDAVYAERLAELDAAGLVYACDCSRKSLHERGASVYDGFCRQRALPRRGEHALRLRVEAAPTRFLDVLQGELEVDAAQAGEDFVLKRKEGFWSYQLAVVVDDIAQGISDIVRGSDLIAATPGQLVLYRYLDAAPPRFLHIPVALDADGHKLSKQTYAAPLHPGDGRQLWLALRFLGQEPPDELYGAEVPEILAHGLDHWRRGRLPHGLGHAPSPLP